jgi:tetratricopeptide (TPR) repeat protein
VGSYPSPQTYEKLIDFYILRNIDKSKILAVYSGLFKVTRTLSEKMYAKFIQAFMKASNYWIEKDILEKVEEYLQSNPGENKDIALKLADAYYDKRFYERALERYLNLLDKVKDPIEILGKIFDIYSQVKIGSGRDVLKLYVRYSSLILGKNSLKIKALVALYEKGEIEEVRKMIDRIDITEDSFIEHSSGLFYRIIKSFGDENTVNEKLSTWLKNALKRKDAERVYKLGRIFFELGKAKEFRKAIPEGFPKREEILNDLEQK